MAIDDMEDTKKGPFCKPFGQLFYDNLEGLPSVQVVKTYLTFLLQAQEKIEKAIAVLEGVIRKGGEKLTTIEDPSRLQHLYQKSITSKSDIETEIEHLSKTRRALDELIASYTEKGILGMPIRDFMSPFDAEYRVKVEKMETDTEKLYTVEINGTDLYGCAGFEHLNKVLTGHILKKLITRRKE